ncbi:hypothetical protein [Serpentinicella alkaliphila]|uniref:Lipoprotein n=1 Tax=Serpentinicella alkaliphila TaxID=1734049 RepID=A0A4R2TV62_9FIRM|nr:hypothetical protein [Serpentinicella alkaliphila]QUH26558.1 hypothetical protein HZR23_13065 [Serpentinicella alkaliphila]TCP99042.1 hypothetical protein EDD79_10375 [Serpentinicella alkaliphila]
MLKKRIGLIIILLCCVFMVSCNAKDSTTLKTEDLNLRITELENELYELQTKVDVYELLDKNFANVSNKTLEFFRAMRSCDKTTLLSMLSSNFTLEDINGNIYIKYSSLDEPDSEWLLCSKSETLKDMVLQGYEYNDLENSFIVHTRLFYLDENGEPTITPIFMTLFFETISWQIKYLYFDV